MLFSKNEKNLKMIWELRSGGRRSWIVGTAHFFPHSFRTSLSRVIRDARLVLFEGPLDPDSLSRVIAAGTNPDGRSHVFDRLDRKTREGLRRAIAPECRDPGTFVIFNLFKGTIQNPVYDMVRGMTPWLAFFTIWSAYLRKHGWTYSVDLEAHRVATEMKKPVMPMETIEEQIEVLKSLSDDRILDFLGRAENWPEYAANYKKWYLQGELEKIKSNVYGFPTRRPLVIDQRDRVFLKRMTPHIEEGGAVVCVGVPHVWGLRELLTEKGWTLRRFT